MTFEAPYTGLEFALKIDGTTPVTADTPVLQPENGDPDVYAWGGKTLIPFSNTIIDPSQEVFVRYRQDDENTTDPEVDYDTSYLPVAIHSISVTCNIPGIDGVFVTNTGDEWSSVNIDEPAASGWVSALQLSLIHI